jgi:hypothetical protein
MTVIAGENSGDSGADLLGGFEAWKYWRLEPPAQKAYPDKLATVLHVRRQATLVDSTISQFNWSAADKAPYSAILSAAEARLSAATGKEAAAAKTWSTKVASS